MKKFIYKLNNNREITTHIHIFSNTYQTKKKSHSKIKSRKFEIREKEGKLQKEKRKKNIMTHYETKENVV